MSISSLIRTVLTYSHCPLLQKGKGKERKGKEKAIEPGEPCDLVREDFVKYYKKLRRDKFLAVLKKHPTASEQELKTIMKEKIKNKKQ